MGLFNRGRMKLPANAEFRISDEGRKKLQVAGLDSKARVLLALETGGTSNVDEIAKASGLSRGQVEACISPLLKYKCVSLASVDEGVEQWRS